MQELRDAVTAIRQEKDARIERLEEQLGLAETAATDQLLAAEKARSDHTGLEVCTMILLRACPEGGEMSVYC